MSLLFFDGFDHYNTNALLLSKWSAATGGMYPTTGAARGGSGNGIQLTAGQSLAWYGSGAGSTWMTAGAAVYLASGATMSIYLDANNAWPAIRFQITADGAIIVWRWDSGTAWTNISAYLLGGGAPTVIPSGAWHYLTVSAYYFSTAAGCVFMNLDGIPMMNVPVQTNVGGPAGLTSFRLAADTGTVNFDDVYATDQKGLDADGSMPAVSVQTVLPAAAGDSTQLTLVGSGSSNWATLAQSAPPSSFANYLFGAADGESDLYGINSPIPSGKTVYGFQMRFWAQASDITPCGLAPLFKLTGSPVLTPNPLAGTPRLLSTTAMYYATPIFMLLPDNSAPLSPGNMNRLQIGLIAARPTLVPNAPDGTQYVYLPSTLLSHVNGTPYSVRVTALAAAGGTAEDAPSDCIAFTVLDAGFAQVAQLVMEVLRTT